VAPAGSPEVSDSEIDPEGHASAQWLLLPAAHWVLHTAPAQESDIMSDRKSPLQYLLSQDWRISFGIIVTLLWIGGGLLYIGNTYEHDPGKVYAPEAIGSFLEGAFAPLAFLWLVLGLFIQQRELVNNTEAIRRTSEQSEKQTLAIAATEMNARQETFFQIAEGVRTQLSGISGMLFISGLGPVGSGRFDRDQIDHMFSQAAVGDTSIFARQFISSSFEEEGGLQKLLYGTEIRERHSRNYTRTFDRLRRLAQNCDVDGIIEDSLLQSAFGLLYQRMLVHDPEAASPANRSNQDARNPEPAKTQT
jgi:hypothetical protein